MRTFAKSLALTLALALASAAHSQRSIYFSQNQPVAGGGSPVTVVHGMSGTNGLCSGASTCSYSFPNSPTSGNTLVLVADVNHGAATLSIASLTGAGCPASFALTTNVATPDSAIGMYAWTGAAAGSGACTVGLSAGGYFSNWDVQSGEFAGAVGVDAYGSTANNGNTTLAFSAGSATTVSGDYAVVSWASNANSNSAVATGWTSAFNANYVGAFGQGSISSGTTVSFSGAPFGTFAENISIMTVLKG